MALLYAFCFQNARKDWIKFHFHFILVNYTKDGNPAVDFCAVSLLAFYEKLAYNFGIYCSK